MTAERYIDVSDLTARAEELETELVALAAEKEVEWDPDSDGLVALADVVGADDVISEAETMREVLDELRGNGGDHNWRGDWYPAQLIHEDEFESAMDDLLEDVGEIPRNLPGYLTITVDYDALRMDYSEIEIGGETYLYR